VSVWEPTFVAFECFFFFEFLTTSILKGYNFFNIPFLTIFGALDMSIRGVQILCKHKKKWSPPLGFSLFKTLKCYGCNSIASNGQLKNLTNMLCVKIPCYKFYKEDLFFYVLTLKVHVSFWDELKKSLIQR